MPAVCQGGQRGYGTPADGNAVNALGGGGDIDDGLYPHLAV